MKITEKGTVQLSINGKATNRSVGRIIAENFKSVENSDKYLVNHLDGNKQNNDITNLE